MDQKHCTLESIDLSNCIILDKDFSGVEFGNRCCVPYRVYGIFYNEGTSQIYILQCVVLCRMYKAYIVYGCGSDWSLRIG